MIDGVLIKDLVRHPDERGFFEEMIRKTDPFFEEGFGQVSHSFMVAGVVKAWHLHTTQTDWWYVVRGKIKVALYDTRETSKTYKELNEFISKLFESESHFITDYILIRPQFAELYPLKFFNHQNKEDYLISSEPKEEIKLDATDLKILKILSENGRTRLIDIAIKSNISSELALYRLKRLKFEKIILGNRIQFNMSQLGYFFTLILINFRNFSEKNKEKIKSFAKASKNANSLIFNLQKPNCVIQLFHKGENELRENIEKIKDLFKEDSIEINILQIGEDEGIVNPLPFL